MARDSEEDLTNNSEADLTNNIWGVLLVGLFGIFFVVATILYFTVTYTCDDPESLAAVSGFYGPGSFFAWCVTAISTLATTDFEFLKHSDTTPRQDEDLENGSPSSPEGPIDSHGLTTRRTKRRQNTTGYDPSLLITIGYPVVASADVIYSVLTDGNVSQRRAAMTVSQVAQVFCSAGIIAAALSRLDSRLFRAWAWGVALSTCCLAMNLGVYADLGDKEENQLEDDLGLGIILLCLQGAAVPVGAGFIGAPFLCTTELHNIVQIPDGRLSRVAFYVLVVLFAAILPSMIFINGDKPGIACHHHFRLAIPRSGASISDLDQAVALAVALVFSAVIPVVQTVYARLQRRAEEKRVWTIVHRFNDS